MPKKNSGNENIAESKISCSKDVYDSWDSVLCTQRLWANLQFIFEVSPEDDNGKSYTIREYLEILGISSATMSNYRQGTTQNPSNKEQLISALNDSWIPRFKLLNGTFHTLSIEQLLNEKLSDIYTMNRNIPFHPEILHGKYICCYAGACTADSIYRPVNYGVINIVSASNPSGERKCDAIFGFTSISDAQKAINPKTSRVSADALSIPTLMYMTGTAYIKTGLLWLNLENDNASRFFSASFNFPGGMLDSHSNYPESIRGIAVSSHLHGAESGSSTFPIAITKNVFTVSESVLKANLRFTAEKNKNTDAMLKELSQNVVTLLETIPGTQSLNAYSVDFVNRLLTIGYEQIVRESMLSVLTYSDVSDAAFFENASENKEFL
ncbi:MAG: hypothetical protein IJY04_02395 [Clostridia bacterium]|nr:hypothetical protein [Clostridia bacterium]